MPHRAAAGDQRAGFEARLAAVRGEAAVAKLLPALFQGGEPRQRRRSAAVFCDLRGQGELEINDARENPAEGGRFGRQRGRRDGKEEKAGQQIKRIAAVLRSAGEASPGRQAGSRGFPYRVSSVSRWASSLNWRGVSLILQVETRYDFQLEGESLIWFRHKAGSAQESVPSFDNAIIFRCWPGSLLDQAVIR